MANNKSASSKKKIVIVVAGCIAAFVVLLILCLPFILGRFQLYSENVWAEKEIQSIDAKTDDHEWVAKEVRSLKWQGKWVSPNMVLMENDMWLTYANSCGKEDWKVGSVFIARASNGNWYKTEHHFCEKGCDTAMTEKPADSLKTFIEQYNLREFDGEPKVRFLEKWRK